jgi:molecular chaperone GrpE
MQEDRKDTAAIAEGIAPEAAEVEYIDAAELDALRSERDELRDRWMRALADAENARKRAERDKREAEAYGASRLARDLLPVHDALRRGLDAANEAGGKDAGEAQKALIEGVELTLRELQSVFARHNITIIAPATGDMFDPRLHQAMFEAPVPGTQAGQIIQVMAEGFLLHDRLLRPAQVGVSSMPTT